MSPLRQQMLTDMVLHGLAKRPQEADLFAVTSIAKYYHRSPDLISPDEIKQYLLHLINDRHLSTWTTNQAGCALKFLYRFTLKRAQTCIEIPLRRAPDKLPECLSRQEVNDIIDYCTNLRHRALLMIAYGSGLRVSELCSLKVGDIDVARMMLRCVLAKAAKTVTPYSLLYCSPPCAAIAKSIAPRPGCFREMMNVSPLITVCHNGYSMPPNAMPISARKAASIVCVTIYPS